MAVGLAVLHWGALVDGMDVEFVLGGCPSSVGSAASHGQVGRQSQLWILDFDKAAKLQPPGLSGTASSQNEHRVGFGDTAMCAQMLKAVTAKDPYFPTPHVQNDMGDRCQGDDDCVDLVVWRAFEEAYLKAAKVLIPRNRGLMELELALESPASQNMSGSWAKEFARMWKAKAMEGRETDGMVAMLG